MTRRVEVGLTLCLALRGARWLDEQIAHLAIKTIDQFGQALDGEVLRVVPEKAGSRRGRETTPGLEFVGGLDAPTHGDLAEVDLYKSHTRPIISRFGGS